MLNQTMENNNLKMIQTEIIQPVSANQQSATFIFRNVGRLSRHTRITLKAVSSAADKYYPLSCGIASLVRSAKLMCNGKILMQNERVAETIAMNSQFQPAQFRKFVQKARIGTSNNWTISKLGTNGSAGGGNGKITLDVDYTPADTFAETSASNASAVPYGLTNDAETTMSGYLSLEDLFPRAYTGFNQDVLQLPLMFVSEEVSLVLTFNKGAEATTLPLNQHRALPSAGGGIGNAFGVEIQLDELKMLVDYLHYEDNSALAKAVMGEGLNLTFGDYDINSFHLQGLAAAAGVENKATHNLTLGLTDKTIRQMYFIHAPAPQVSPTGGDEWKRPNIFNGPYCSPCPSRLPDGVSLNMKINGQNIYVNPVSNYAEHCNRLSSAYGVVWDMPFSTYCHWDAVGDELDAVAVAAGGANVPVGTHFENKSLLSKQSTINGHALLNGNSVGMQGAFFYMGVDLQKSIMDVNSGAISRLDYPGTGTRVGSVPLQITLTRKIPNGFTDDNRTLLIVSVVEKSILIRDGGIEVV